MDPERWARVQDLFHGALELPPADRDAWIEARLRGEIPEEARALAQEVESLLRLDESSVEILDGGVSRAARGVLKNTPAPPEQAGPYRILGLLGEGGMGVVSVPDSRSL
jgi:eukaryotic-like serine/threonine-protein kinase